MLKVFQSLSGFAVFAAFFFSCLFSLSFVNRVNIYRNRDRYRPDKFLVTGAEFHRGSAEEGGDSWWLNGTVAANDERLVPFSRGDSSPQSAGDLLARYPRGTQVEVLYDPEATHSLVQGESLRVLVATPDFRQEEAQRRYRLALEVFTPVPVTLAVYLAVRYWNRRRERRLSQPVEG